MTAPDFLDLSATRRIAYHKLSSSAENRHLPGVIFLGGFKSDMEGTKALFLEDWARAGGRAFLRFDYTGHGRSSGNFEEGAISDWADDAFEAADRLTDGPQVLVGSSMGGWLSLLLARRAPAKVAAFVGIAAAPDFTLSMRAEMDDAARAEMSASGRWSRPSGYADEPYVITRRLLDDGDENLVLAAPLDFDFPVRLLQGTADTDVPVEVAERLFAHVASPDTRLTLVKGADHRFSGERELTLLRETVEEASRAATGGANRQETP